MSLNRVYLYDTTLRDGAQTSGVDFSPADKQSIALELDQLGLDYIEGGWPGANPTDNAFFATLPILRHARLTAFGMTRRSGVRADDDLGLNAVLDTDAKILCMVGKSWDFQVEVALGIGLDENLGMIKDSITFASAKSDEVIFDAEHFFDGFKANPQYAMACLNAALDAGARMVQGIINGLGERLWTSEGTIISLSEATVKIAVVGGQEMAVAEGNGVHWSTLGVSANVIDAAYSALRDSIVYKLLRDGVSALPPT